MALDDLLWEMGTRESCPTAAEPSAEELAAYREGRLPREEAEKMERTLSHAVGGRRRLAELAGVEPVLPDSRVRQALLARFHGAGPVERRVRLVVQAALVAMGLSVLWLARSPERLPAELAYDVRAEGLATVRRPPPSSRRVEAFPDTRIRITVSPRPAAIREVEFGLYRREDRLFERLDFDSKVRLEVIRGAAVVDARAGDLADPADKVAELMLVAARPGNLPRRFAVEPSEAVKVISEPGVRQAYPLEIHFRAPPPY